ncbi:MAG: EI24 domain-containing protein [Cyanobacterium sp. T60_A2020_053]|nr:EI24 domain-containing protein [Cyanobacterium sp. T60_A2020_053]
MLKNIISGFGFLTGFFYPFQALNLIAKNKSLWQYLIIPILINIIIGIITYLLILQPSLNLWETVVNNLVISLQEFIKNLPQWLNILIIITNFISSIIRGLLLIVMFIVIGIIIAQFGGVLGAPWYGKLSEKIEVIKRGQLEIIEIDPLQDIVRAILFELKKILLSIIVGLPLFLLNFIPAVGNVISVYGGSMLTITIVCLDFLDATLERKRLKFREKLTFVFKEFPRTFGFGLACLIMISIPLLNLIIVPMCVCAGTLLVCDRHRSVT